MAKRKIVWTNTAALQRRHILQYWKANSDSPTYAKKLITKLKKRTTQLSIFPFSGIQTPFPNTRVTHLGHFSLFYKATGNLIIIMAFWDNRQDPEKLYNLLIRE